jgi:hypothetical protein
VSLGRVLSTEIWKVGEYEHIFISDYEEYDTPSPMHELSPLSATHRISASSGAARLRSYCIDNVGLQPISSEWWHFNDRESTQAAAANGITGDFFILSIHSTAPYPTPDNIEIIVFSTGPPHIADFPLFDDETLSMLLFNEDEEEESE